MANFPQSNSPEFPMLLVSGEYFGNGNGTGGATGSAGNFTTGSLYGAPVYLPRATSVDELVVWCVANTGGGTFTAGFYNIDPDGTPTSLIWGMSSGQTVSATGNIQVAISPAITLPKRCVFAFAISNNSDDFTHFTATATSPYGTKTIASGATEGRGNPGIVASWTYDAGNLPSTFPTSGFATRYQAPAFQVKVA